jgi:hypothetical protein
VVPTGLNFHPKSPAARLVLCTEYGVFRTPWRMTQSPLTLASKLGFTLVQGHGEAINDKPETRRATVCLRGLGHRLERGGRHGEWQSWLCNRYLGKDGRIHHLEILRHTPVSCTTFNRCRHPELAEHTCQLKNMWYCQGMWSTGSCSYFLWCFAGRRGRS